MAKFEHELNVFTLIELVEERQRRIRAEADVADLREKLNMTMGELAKERLNLLQTQRNASSSCDSLASDLLGWQMEKTEMEADRVRLTERANRLENLEMELEREREAKREALRERDRAYTNFAREREARAEDGKEFEWKLDRVRGNLDKERNVRSSVDKELSRERRLYGDSRHHAGVLKADLREQDSELKDLKAQVATLKDELEKRDWERRDIERECKEPFVVPALLEMFQLLSRTTTTVMQEHGQEEGEL